MAGIFIVTLIPILAILFAIIYGLTRFGETDTTRYDIENLWENNDLKAKDYHLNG
ncbi:hypothetical protein WD019_12630 [Fictibacillus sp. Mic-4]|uniref:hypothetical protein n=1 Tax=Fictibacillus TaxID=1329200 RepID=UPI000422DA09|nr:hypothetical protein [Fictibacillus gelatini]